MSLALKSVAVALAIATLGAAAVAAAQDNTSQDPEIQRLNLERARDEAAITGYQKEKARSEAEVAARMAAIDALPEAKAGEFKITPGTNAGLAEARILSAQQLNTVARMIANDVDLPSRVIVLTSEQRPDLARYREYEARRERIAAMYAEVIDRRPGEIADRKDELLGDAEEPRGVREASLATITSGIGLAARLVSLFRSSYDISGGDVTTMDSNYLATSVASGITGNGRTVLVGWEWIGQEGYSTVVRELGVLDQRRILASRLLTDIEQERARYAAAAAADEGDDDDDKELKAKYQKIAELYANFDAEITNALNAHELFVRWLTTGAQTQPNDPPMPPPYADVIRQLSLAQEFDRAAVLVVQVHSATQGNMVRSNLWTFLGGPPFSVAASSSITARLIDPRTGATTFAGVYGCDSPYTRMNRIHSRARSGQNLVTCRRLS